MKYKVYLENKGQKHFEKECASHGEALEYRASVKRAEARQIHKMADDGGAPSWNILAIDATSKPAKKKGKFSRQASEPEAVETSEDRNAVK